jgi:hypothetical protein
MSPVDTIRVLTPVPRIKRPDLGGAGLERVNYFPQQLITAEDMKAEQDYFRQKLRRHNRFLHGWGTVCGLIVAPAPIEGEPWRVSVSSGYALSPQGDEIYVPETVCLDLAKCGLVSEQDPCEPLRVTIRPHRQDVLYLAIRYVECPTRPVRVHPAGCGCEGAACQYTRIRDDFELGCLDELPDDPGLPGICELHQRGAVMPCLPCPESPWVVLAKIAWPDTQSDPLTAAHIDNSVRRQLYSTAMIQQQLIECCCERRPEPPPPTPQPAVVTAVQPTNGQIFVNNAPNNVTLTFSKDLSPASVNTGSVQVMNPAGQIVPGSVSYNAASRTAVFTPQGPFTQFMTGQESEFTVIARGSGPGPIMDTDNLALDGDANGSPGGNFTSKFVIRIVIG